MQRYATMYTKRFLMNGISVRRRKKGQTNRSGTNSYRGNKRKFGIWRDEKKWASLRSTIENVHPCDPNPIMEEAERLHSALLG